MITPKDIENKTMTEAKRREAKNSYFAFYIGRPLTYILTIPFLYTNISPNFVTLISVLCAIAGFICLSLAQDVSFRLIGLLLFFLWSMGDGIDGNIARYKNLKSENGDLLDTLGGYLSLCLIMLSMGYTSYYDSVIISPFLPVILGGISAVSTLIPRLLMHRKLARNGSGASGSELKDKESYSFFKIIVLNVCDPAGFQLIIMLIAILFHLTSLFTIVYCALNLLIMIYSIYGLLEKENKI